MVRTECHKCSRPVRGRRLCTQCALDRRYGQGLDDEDDDETTTETRCECSKCGTEYVVMGNDRKECPDCESPFHYQLSSKEVALA